MSSSAAGKENTEPDDLNIGLIATVVVVGALLVLAIAIALTALVRSESIRFGESVGTFANLGTVKRLKEEQRAKLSASPAWVDKGKGVVAMPIDRAMELVAGEIRTNPTLATLAPPAPPPEAAPAPAPEAAAPAVEGKSAPETKGKGEKPVKAEAPKAAPAPAAPAAPQK
jgi:hypothetical protein